MILATAEQRWFISCGLYAITEGAVQDQPLPQAVPAPAFLTLPSCQRPLTTPSLPSIKGKREEPFRLI